MAPPRSVKRLEQLQLAEPTSSTMESQTYILVAEPEPDLQRALRNKSFDRQPELLYHYSSGICYSNQPQSCARTNQDCRRNTYQG